jgi:HD-like signal output (HDOD) protein
LLHDFGKVVYAQNMPAEFRQAIELSNEKKIPLHMAEQEVIGADHSVVGAMLVERWQFPKSLLGAIRYHHSNIAPENTVQSCLFLADEISKKLSEDGPSDFSKVILPAAMVARFGSVQEIVSRLGDLSKVVEEAAAFTRGSQEATA